MNEVLKRARHLVEQYDNHGRFREIDTALHNHGEPDEVAIARALLTCVDNQIEDHDLYAKGLEQLLDGVETLPGVYGAIVTNRYGDQDESIRVFFDRDHIIWTDENVGFTPLGKRIKLIPVGDKWAFAINNIMNPKTYDIKRDCVKALKEELLK